MNNTEVFNPERFVEAQEKLYETVLNELQNGKKETHWIWYIFPQLTALGRSSTAKFYGIGGKVEAFAYLQHPILRERLETCVKAVLNCNAMDPVEIFGTVDALKFRSCLTLFSIVEPENSLFKTALDTFFNGTPDIETVDFILNEQE
jgi:uncharacterized protein (DUF1810 family)